MSKDKPASKPAEKSKSTEEKAKPTPPKIEKPKYGVPELAELLGTKASSVRVRLRAAGVPKKGKLYGWDTKDEMKAVAEKIKAKTKSKSDDDGDEDEDEDGDDE